MYHLVEVTKYNHSPNHYIVLASFDGAEEVLDAQAHKRKEKEIFSDAAMEGISTNDDVEMEIIRQNTGKTELQAVTTS